MKCRVCGFPTYDGPDGEDVCSNPHCGDLGRSASTAEIKRLRAEVRRLRRALREIVAFGSDTYSLSHEATLAQAALRRKDGGA